MATPNGGSGESRGPLELSDVLSLEMHDGASVEYEVVGILEDPEERVSYAVLRHEPEEDGDESFIVTDLQGNLLDDEDLAQEILDDFLAFADEDGEERGAHNGEAR
jgi:hypothetical protein